LLEVILYKPQFRWRVQRIAVRRPVRFLAFRRNEVKSKAATRSPQPILAEEDRTQRNTLALRDVDYVIEASLELTPLANQSRRKPPGKDEPPGDDNIGKYYGMARRRIESGQCFSQPCFGCREFPAHFEPADASTTVVPAGLNPDSDLGLMLYDVFDLDVLHTGQKAEARPQVTFFRARLENGVLHIPRWSEVKKQLGGAS
jgi:CRISPR-associated protein Cas5d